MRPELRSAIFERFRQGDGAINREVAGTGLGLAIVREFAQLQGGKVSVEDSDLGGARFEIELPVLEGTRPEQVDLSSIDRFIVESSLDGVLEELQAPRANLSKNPIIKSDKYGRVLVVEDNAEMSRFIAECLASEFEVLTAVDGEEGYEVAISANPDLIITDIMMPRVSGDQLVAMLRKQAHMNDVPILLLSAKADEDLKNHLLENGAQDFISKPFSERDLLARSRNLVDVKLAKDNAREIERSRLAAVEERNRQLLERSKQLGAVFEQAPSFMVLLHGPHHQILLANSRFFELIGERELIGSPVATAVPEAVEQGFLAKLDIAFASGEANVFEAVPFDVLKSSGSQPARYYLDFVQQPIFDSEGVVTGIVVQGVDVTGAHEDKLALQVSQAALRQAQKMEAVGQLTGGIAHDFNNLLASISGSLEILKLQVDKGNVTNLERYVAMGQSSVRRAASLTQRLLAFSRRQTLDPKPTNVNKLIVGLEDLIRRTVGPTIDVEVVSAAGLWTTKVDGGQLENSLLNLCINARDSMLPDGGRLTIETANKRIDDRAAKTHDLTPGQYISICVTDTGSGMTSDVIERAFDPFFTTKPLGQGTGLGLSMVYGFVRQSDGQVRIYSEVGQGTTMCLYLPRYHGDVAMEETADHVYSADQGSGEVVLLIDDEETIRILVSEVLRDWGYRVLTAADGPSGLRVLQTEARIDLLITDVGLPGGLNGRQVADAARVSRAALKVLFITGYAENAAVGNGLLEPGMEVVTKPFEILALATKVRQMIEN